MAETAVTGVRSLLRSVRGVMAGHGNAQKRLDELVKVIAGEMVAEVCTVYVMRAGLSGSSGHGSGPPRLYQGALIMTH